MRLAAEGAGASSDTTSRSSCRSTGRRGSGSRTTACRASDHADGARSLGANWAAEATFLRTTLPGTDIPLILVANDYFFDREQIYSPRLDGYDDFMRALRLFLPRRHPRLRAARHRAGHRALPRLAHRAAAGLSALGPARQRAVPRRALGLHDPQPQLPGRRLAPRRSRSLGLHSRYWAPDALEHFGDVNLMKGGIIFADQVTTVSPNYAREIRTPTHGAGLDGVLRASPSRSTASSTASTSRSGIRPPIRISRRNFDAGHARTARAVRSARCCTRPSCSTSRRRR